MAEANAAAAIKRTCERMAYGSLEQDYYLMTNIGDSDCSQFETSL